MAIKNLMPYAWSVKEANVYKDNEFRDYMDKSTGIILIVLALVVFGISYYQAYTYNAFGEQDKKIDIIIYNLCFDIFNLERDINNVNSNVLDCQQVILLQQIKDMLSEKVESNFEQVNKNSEL